MRDKPDLAEDRIIAGLRDSYGIAATELEFLPIGHDSAAWVYLVGVGDEENFFLKVRKGPPDEIALRVPRYLKDAGVDEVVAPIPPVGGEKLWGSIGDYSLILYPYIQGRNAADVGLSDADWVEYGALFRKIHATRLSDELRKLLPRETFESSWCRGVQQLPATIETTADPDPRVRELAAIWAAHREQISRIVERMEELSRALRTRPFERVLCHADLHLANVLVDPEGRLLAVDWDAPILAPRERDLHFVIGSEIVPGMVIGPREEALIFQGYGPTTIDWPALIYFRYEWVCGDLFEYGRTALGLTGSGDVDRADAIRITRDMFEPGNAVATADALVRRGQPWLQHL
jgi:spectinomycin phosphotransferase